jgi:UDP-N-acetylglucosamine--N-acetylmuramyl-(pentapeptide) pyrophosphoryl-undecaprenol N-acetylglucosamine transferase
MRTKYFWIVAAGTGGHIFPGIEIVKQLQAKLGLGAESFLFFGTPDRLEAKIIPDHGYPLKLIKATAWKGKGLFTRIAAPLSILSCILLVCGLYLKRGRPQAMISVGGYVSVPVAIFCILARIPFYLHEPNIKTGVANRLLSKFARMAFTVPFSDALKVMKCTVKDFGNPVRAAFQRVRLRQEPKHILVLGGSQGARKLCDASFDLLKELLSFDKEVRLTLQSGQSNLDYSLAKQKQLYLQPQSQVLPFIKELMPLLEKSDLVIARAGAMTLAELSLVGLPTILVPFPHAADDHQRVNAKLLEQAGAVRVVDEKEADFAKLLSTHVRDLMLSGDSLRKRLALSEAFLKTARPRAGQDIAQAIVSDLSAR